MQDTFEEDSVNALQNGKYNEEEVITEIVDGDKICMQTVSCTTMTESLNVLDGTSTERYLNNSTDLDVHDTRIPITALPGENLLHKGKTFQGHAAILTDYRFFIAKKNGVANVPLGLIESVENINPKDITILCKDMTVLSCFFPSTDVCSEWLSNLRKYTGLKSYEDLFAVKYFKATKSDSSFEWTSNSKPKFRTEYEMERLKFHDSWRITEINKGYNICNGYPQKNIVPAEFDDDLLKIALEFRTMRRFPSAVWRNKDNGAVLLRSSQPVVGVFCNRNTEDEKLLQAIIKASGCSKELLVVDARSYTAAVANRAKGGGCEYPEYYTNCDIRFMNLPNIHAIRTSFNSVRALLSSEVSDASWYSMLDATKWMSNLALLIEASRVVAEGLSKQPVLVHCSDGWDRTTQIVSLAQLIVDPYYRTFDGFQMLVEKEWLYFGHKFADRCGNSVKGGDPNEISPVFLQWIDSVHQLIHQFPAAFEFDSVYLMKLMKHTYSCLFGTFLFNNMFEKENEKFSMETVSIWSYLAHCKPQLKNSLYSENTHKIINVSSRIRDLDFWLKAYSSKSIESHYFVPVADNSSNLNRNQSHSRSEISLSVEDLSDAQNVLIQRSQSETGKLNIQDNIMSQHPFNTFDSINVSMSSSSVMVDLNQSTKNESCTQPTEDDNYDKYLDKSDGLTFTCNPYQLKICELKNKHETERRRLEQLIEELKTTNISSPKSVCSNNYLLSPEPDTELNSVGNSSRNSFSSYEDVDSHETGPKLWVPDHAAITCASCNASFSRILRRKHHCRRCGMVFCNGCADVYIPVPEQQLFEPVRVCNKCHSDLMHQNMVADDSLLLHEGGLLEEMYQSSSDNSSKSSMTQSNASSAISIPIRRKNTAPCAHDSASCSPSICKAKTLIDAQLSKSQQSLHSQINSKMCQKTCSQESVNAENGMENGHMIGARAEC